jgi:hypothetical protein
VHKSLKIKQQTKIQKILLSRNKKAINEIFVDEIILFKFDDVNRRAADPTNYMCVCV